ncbi:MAG TPA: hypothetical protein VHI13_05320 [Candidatus Kapabacteria bacterium]|nr:hypothetical protein [Candidatus Kapabacteria bacterium]
MVIYRDAFAHGDTSAPDGGDPLVFASRDEALIHYPEAFCSYYALNADQADRVVSLTHLVIGNRRFELAYRQVNPIGTSPEAWASNRGAFEVMVVREYPARHYDAHVARPLWSVDYVMALHGKMVIPMPTAFDFNIAPMLANTGISRLLSAEETARLILDAYDYYASMGSANAAGVPAIANPETENPEAASRYREDEEAGPFLEEPEVVPVDGIPSGGTPGAGMPVDAALPEDAGPNWERTAGEHSEGVQPESMQPEGVRHEGGLPDLPGDQ